jgi:hypothetical protein
MTIKALDALVRNLSPDLIDSLGKKPDAELANEFKVSVEVVKWARKKHGIPTFTYAEGLLKNSEFQDLLGKITDVAIAKKFNCAAATVQRIRTSLGIPTFVREATQELIDALGKMPDADIASKFECPISSVIALRRSHGIRSGTYIKQLAFNEEFLSSLGKIKDEDIALKFRCSVTYVRKARNSKSVPPKHDYSVTVSAAWQAKYLQEVLPLLGKISDAELARRYGGLNSRYRHLRLKRGIPAHQSEVHDPAIKPPKEKLEKVSQTIAQPKQSRRSRRKPTYSIPDEVKERLGKIADKQLSAETGTPFEHIKHYRTWLKIPPYRKRVVIPQELIDSLGKMKDEEVAEKFGRKFTWVKKERKKRGIPAFKLISTPGLAESLGAMHDFDVADKFGVSLGWVGRERVKRGIPAFKEQKGAESAGELRI